MQATAGETVAACAALLRRYAPVYMKAASSGVREESERFYLSLDEETAIVHLRTVEKLKIATIARRVSRSSTTVHNVMRKHGIAGRIPKQ